MDLSVIISAYGMQRYLAACLRSVTRCSREYIDLECIVVHDSNEDETAAIVNRYSERDNRIRLVMTACEDSSDPRNKGIELALGKYILLLDASDRLCEDAWEQIEAAVEEEYADFVAFSHITMNRKGKLRAQMLPISEVVSTDVQEARRLMFAKVVLDTCWGKLFRSDVVRDNHITFRTDVPGSADFFFVVEYFEHCETFLLTKAMLLYCMPRDENRLQNYSMGERLGFLGIRYDFHMDAVRRCNDSALTGCVPVYYFSEITNLFAAYAREYHYNKKALADIYKRALAADAVRRILSEVDERRIHSGIRKYEYRLFRDADVEKLRRYFSLKVGLNVRKMVRTARMGAMVLGMVLLSGGCSKKIESVNIKSGMELVEQYDFQGAISYFEQALLNNEDMELAYRGQGIACMGLGKYADAETAFLKSIESAGRHLTALEYDTNYYLAAAYMKQGKYAQAEEIYSAIIALKKKEKDAYYLRACALLRQNRYDEAVADFEKAFSFDSDNLDLLTDAYVEMQAAGFSEQGQTYLQEFMTEKGKKLSEGERGILYYYLEDYENARIYLDSFVNGKDPKLSMILGQTYEKLGDMNYAAIVYQSYLDANEPNAAIYNSLGVCLMHQEKYDEAMKAFESGIEMGASDNLQELRFNLIVANEYSGNFAQAKKMMQEYLQSYPDDARAKKENEFLKSR